MEPTERTDPQCISGSPHAKSMRSVDGQMQWANGVTFQAATDLSANQIALCGANSTEGVFPHPSDTPSEYRGMVAIGKSEAFAVV